MLQWRSEVQADRHQRPRGYSPRHTGGAGQGSAGHCRLFLFECCPRGPLHVGACRQRSGFLDGPNIYQWVYETLVYKIYVVPCHYLTFGVSMPGHANLPQLSYIVSTIILHGVIISPPPPPEKKKSQSSCTLINYRCFTDLPSCASEGCQQHHHCKQVSTSHCTHFMQYMWSLMQTTLLFWVLGCFEHPLTALSEFIT